MKQAGDAGTGLWITEIGWGSQKGGNPLNRGRKGQAQSCEWCPTAGLFDSALRPKPAWRAPTKFTGGS